MSAVTAFHFAPASALACKARLRTCITPRRRSKQPLPSIPSSNFPLPCRGFLRGRKFGSLVSGSCGDDGGGILGPSPPSVQDHDVGDAKDESSGLGDAYLGYFVRMLGLDNDPLDREQAVVTLWKYSLGGKKQVDAIMQFQGCLNLVVNLLKSNSNSASEAAAGLLRSVSSINIYRRSVADSGAIEAITTLLGLPSLTPEVKEQCLCTLWNLSVEEDLRLRIATIETLPLVISSLDDEDLKVKESAGGLLATLALSESNHEILVELCIIPKLAAALLTSDEEGSKIVKKEAKNVLLELAKNDYYRILIIEEGLLPVPMVGTDAYKSFEPSLYSWPSLPDGTEIEQTSKGPSRFGASELLLGLNVNDDSLKIEEAKQNAIIGRTRQQFLARIGAIELDQEEKSSTVTPLQKRLTLLPFLDGVARLVLILGLEDESAVIKAAESMADASINEDMRTSFKEAGAIKKLIHLLYSENDAVIKAAIRALERLSLSSSIALAMEAEDVVHPLTNILTKKNMSDSILDQIMSILSRILDPSKEMKSKFYDGPVHGTSRSLEAPRSSCTSNGPEGTTSASPDRIRGMLDSSIICPLVEILKSESPNLQRKAASILEFAALTSSIVDAAILDDMESGLQAIFHQKILTESDDIEGERPEKYMLEVEEAGLAISSGCRLLTKLLDSEEFCNKINPAHFTSVLREILKSDIPVNHKDWVAACLIKLYSLSSSKGGFNDPINTEVTLYETIPRLVETMKTSSSPEAQEGAAVELNRIISEGVVNSTRAVAAEGGIFPLVNLLGEGNERTADAALSILYNLSMDSENHAAIIAAGAVPVLRRIVLSQRPQWTRALRLLWTLPV
ncbi:hypothetical protein MLD38_017557 [Melastoma candidum]|uniref:Uncharacterized protein n=1 Tax=Melastoma candidum TaxID=119954 RepID=A0ACB9QU41_9MYRT|nr:hypothetical protein MLD38_017557 [Melastoma candidum]